MALFSAKLVSSLLLAIVASSIIVGISRVEGTWCVVTAGARPAALQPQLDYACGHGADCRAIQPGGSCFNPNTIQNHASYAFDSYYQRHRRAPGSCNFGGLATIAVTDPSFGRCKYPPALNADGGATTTVSKKNQDVKLQNKTNKVD